MTLITNKGVKSIAALAVLFIGAIPFESCSDDLPGEEYLGEEVQSKRYVCKIDKESFGNIYSCEIDYDESNRINTVTIAYSSTNSTVVVNFTCDEDSYLTYIDASNYDGENKTVYWENGDIARIKYNESGLMSIMSMEKLSTVLLQI